ncbi:trypsin-like peptidase domain-containing protein [Erythrobacter sp. A6_0]|uniref:trypsin-like peptidase domain-containing protein n=1 Tax=Erythrobacter sp. A6_0 TaxID=2821089 RepID=UPI001AD9A8F1|nr:trypsin-like peptidase domain-containing protein [Erythrobacter sp. A6_0]MBO9509962.1 trypsin-like peptidase domain-containing protein [Erythrobacter sp. A6_0]|tara:strand:+ start:342 stop:1160 length:819 start_codon:yes stop_codon:yes gene_type:complete
MKNMANERAVVRLDPYSLCVTKLEIYRHERPSDPIQLAIGTGFFYKRDSRIYLVTAWHNVTGIHPATGQSISNTGARPTNFAVRFITSDVSSILYLNLGLYDENGNPAWLIHPKHQQSADLVAIPIPKWPSEAINEFIGELDDRALPLEVGADVFIIGFPRGVDRGLAPLWKKGALAVDPDTARGPSAPFWLVDSASRTGMSGSPVVLRRFSPFEDEHGTLFSRGSGTKFIGLYSGRFEDSDPLGAHLGIVWPKELIEEVLDAGEFDRSMER